MLVCSCLDLHELLDQEEHFSEHDELEDMFNHYPPRVRMISSLEYDPDNDDYEMQVMPQLPEQIEVEQNQLIEKQIARLQQRIDLGGIPEILDHYREVREILLQDLGRPSKCDDGRRMRISSCDTDLASATPASLVSVGSPWEEADSSI